MIEKTKPASGFTDIFLSKLKEQSFVIMLMLGVIYYQHRLMEERVAFWMQEHDKKELYIQQLTKEDRETMQDRIKYLQDQQDKYTQDAIDELK
jgi:superfamily II DNA helicase RecQ